MANENLVIRRVRKGKRASPHGGSWKIALADFALAMMAFFIVLWVINVSSPQELAVIQGYFNDPLGTSTAGASRSPIDLGGSPAKSIEQKLDLDLPEPGSTMKEEKEPKLGRDMEQMKKVSDMLYEQFRSMNHVLSQENNLRIELTPKGVRITLIDAPDQPMFERGSARMMPDYENILLSMAPIFVQLGNPVAIAGHTDASRFSGGNALNNWDLSALRANATRRLLEEGGISYNKVAQVVGLADSVPYDPVEPTSDVNRRVSITLLTDQAYQALLSRNIADYGPADVEGEALDLTPTAVF
ncbi:flagellar motor protein MotB [Marinomonas epiphytica]